MNREEQEIVYVVISCVMLLALIAPGIIEWIEDKIDKKHKI